MKRRPPQRVKRHPWEKSLLFQTAPAGRRKVRSRRKDTDAWHLLADSPAHRIQHQTPRILDFDRTRVSSLSYIGGIIRAEKGILYDIGGVEDHLHIYLRWRPDGLISDLMRTVKARSSAWMHETFPNLAGVAWQEGYSVFSVSKSREEFLKRYIAGQAEHHKKEDFRVELLRLLRAHGVEFDEKYVFD